MKNLLILTLTLLSLTAQAQNLSEISRTWKSDDGGQPLGEIIKTWIRKDIDMVDGKSVRYILPDDTARYFQHGDKRFSVLIIFTELDKLAGYDTVMVDDQTPENVTSGAIGQFPNSSGTFYNNTLTYRTSTSISGSIEFTFTGVGIDWITETAPSHGSVTIDLDGQSEVIKLYEAPYGSQVSLFQKRGLVNGPHKITISSNVGQFVHDGWRVYKLK